MYIIKNKNYSEFHIPHSAQKGVAALVTILMVGGITVEIIIAVIATSYLFAQSEFGSKLSADAYFAASGGVQDAIMRIIRDKSFTQSVTTLSVGGYSADVSVCKDLPCAELGKHKILSVGKAQSRRRQLEAILNVDSLTGEVRLESLKEVSL